MLQGTHGRWEEPTTEAKSYVIIRLFGPRGETGPATHLIAPVDPAARDAAVRTRAGGQAGGPWAYVRIENDQRKWYDLDLTAAAP